MSLRTMSVANGAAFSLVVTRANKMIVMIMIMMIFYRYLGTGLCSGKAQDVRDDDGDGDDD